MRIIECARCGCEIGRCTEYELYTGNMDTSEPEYNDDYGGWIDDEGDVCRWCYKVALSEQEAEEEAA